MAKIKVKDKAEELLGSFLSDNGLELYNTEFVKEGRDWFLRIYIDKAEGSEDEYVGIDDCELVSRYLSEKLDEEDIIEQNYYLEVSSPGLDRELIKEKDYRRFAGKIVEVSLYKAFNGSKNYEGRLISLSDGILSIETVPVKKGEKPEIIGIPFEQVAKTKLAVIF